MLFDHMCFCDFCTTTPLSTPPQNQPYQFWLLMVWSLDEIGWLAASWRYLVEAKSGSLDVPWGHVVPGAWRR